MSTIKALVVDDSKIMRSQVKRALDQLLLAEFEYEEAMDGEDALEKFSDKQIAQHFSKMDITALSQSCLETSNLQHQVDCFRIAARALEWRCRTHAPEDFNKALQIVMHDDFQQEKSKYHQYISTTYT